MREIKFRAWDKCNNKMIDVTINYSGTPIVAGYNILTTPVRACDLVVMQYTGLTIEGRKMFEGDIYYIAGQGNSVVKICPMYGVVFVGPDNYELPYIDVIAEQDLGHWLGNIHEQPELIK